MPLTVLGLWPCDASSDALAAVPADAAPVLPAKPPSSALDIFAAAAARRGEGSEAVGDRGVG